MGHNIRIKLFTLFFLLTFMINSGHSQSLKKLKQNAKSTYTNTSRKVNQSLQRTKSNVQQNYQTQRKKVSESTTKVRNNIQDRVNNTKKELNNYNKNFKVSEEDKKKYRKLNNDFKSTFLNRANALTYSDIDVNELAKQTGILILKNYPMYDDEEKRIVTMDYYMRKFVASMDIENPEGNDLYEDPLGTAFLMMFDDDYMFEAKIIDDGNGNYVSINELSGKTNTSKVRSSHNEVKRAIESKNTYRINSSIEEFNLNVSKLSEEVNKNGYDKNTLVIINFIKAEDRREFDEIFNFFSKSITRYWDVNYPSYYDLKSQYEKAWNVSSNSQNQIIKIDKLSNNQYVLTTEFSFYDNKKRINRSVFSKVKFVLDNNYKILQVYGVK